MKTRDRFQAYRERHRKAGRKGVLLMLPADTIELIDQLQRARGYRSRSAAAIAIINEGTKRIEIPQS